MNTKIKLAAYAVLLLLVAGFGWGFHVSYTAVNRESAAAAAAAETEAAETPAPAAETNAASQTNLESTNSVAVATNQAPSAPTNSPPAVAAAAPPPHSAQGRSIGYLAALVISIIALGILIAYDVTQLFGNAAVDALLDVGGEGSRDPDYEKAEQAWAKGNFLDAIQLLREFLKKNPRAQYAALRIAEIYEKDLDNVVAAALEYEEVLKQKLPAERWGWAAVHLCNLYSKMGQQDKTRALLQRIADEYPKTAAAKKARSRLGIAEPEPEAIAKDGTQVESGEGESSAKPEPASPESPAPAAKSNLPPGFRPK